MLGFVVFAGIPFMVGCFLGTVCFRNAMDLAFFRIPYLWKFADQNYMSRSYVVNTVSTYKRNAWLWFFAAVVPAAVSGFWVSSFPVALPFLVGMGCALVYAILDHAPSESDVKQFARQHMQELMSSGWWESEEEAINGLAYNKKVEERLERGDIFGGLRR